MCLSSGRSDLPEKGSATSSLNLTNQVRVCLRRLLILAAIAATWHSPSFAQRDGFDMEFVALQPGAFQMGCSAGDRDCEDDEKPAHQVRITRPFEIGKYEVTREQWGAVMRTTTGLVNGKHPIGDISWNDIQQFMARLNARNDGYRYRLATEAEWEYAARAGTSGRYPGDLDAIAWHGDIRGRSHPVGLKKPNAWGLYDMIGNVSEWVQDWYGATQYAVRGPQDDPGGQASGQERVVRGGSWGSADRYSRVSHRGHGTPDVRSSNWGFRCVREPA
jgi:formylglycine-generating enzyme required for sulfatase activity